MPWNRIVGSGSTTAAVDKSRRTAAAAAALLLWRVALRQPGAERDSHAIFPWQSPTWRPSAVTSYRIAPMRCIAAPQTREPARWLAPGIALHAAPRQPAVRPSVGGWEQNAHERACRRPRFSGATPRSAWTNSLSNLPSRFGHANAGRFPPLSTPAAVAAGPAMQQRDAHHRLGRSWRRRLTATPTPSNAIQRLRGWLRQYSS
jgi:hypothetical protein